LKLLQTPFQKEFLTTPDVPWPSEDVATVRAVGNGAGNFTYILVKEAGHFVRISFRNQSNFHRLTIGRVDGKRPTGPRQEDCGALDSERAVLLKIVSEFIRRRWLYSIVVWRRPTFQLFVARLVPSKYEQLTIIGKWFTTFQCPTWLSPPRADQHWLRRSQRLDQLPFFYDAIRHGCDALLRNGMNGMITSRVLLKVRGH
jgi:hypothetical protein